MHICVARMENLQGLYSLVIRSDFSFVPHNKPKSNMKISIVHRLKEFDSYGFVNRGVQYATDSNCDKQQIEL